MSEIPNLSSNVLIRFIIFNKVKSETLFLHFFNTNLSPKKPFKTAPF